MTKLEEVLETIHNEIDEGGFNPTRLDINDDDDLIIFALNFLLSNLDDAFVGTVWCSEHDCYLEDCP